MKFYQAGFVFMTCYVIAALFILVYLRLETNKIGRHLNSQDSLVEYRPKKPHWDNPTGCSYTEEEVIKPKFVSIGKNIYVLSAFFDNRSPNVTYIRILALVPDNAPIQDVFCHVKKTAADTIPIKPKIVKLRPGNSTTYASAMLLCDVHRIVNRNPCKVHLSLDKQHSADDNSIFLHLLPLTERKFTKTFGVCPPPVWGFITITRFVEFIELSKLLGADQVFFYVFSGTAKNVLDNDQISRVMEYYDEHDVSVTHYSWDLPVGHKDVWQYGRMLAMHHCLYTNMYKFKYLMFNDMDEFIVPQGTSNWNSIMNALDTPNTGEFSFETAYFIPEISESIISINSLFRTEATDTVKTKGIIKPQTVAQLGVYNVKEWAIPNTYSSKISKENALVHHYRFCDPRYGIACQDHVEDKTVEKYSSDLKAKFKVAMTGILGYDAGLEEGDIMGQRDY